MRWLALLLAIAPAAAGAQTIVTSSGPGQVGVTVYRDAFRANLPLRRGWLNGYALISETRSVTLPAGESELRFEGVASGIIPQSAIIGGLPEGLVERNRDARLLSAGSLVDASLGRRVSLRRTDRATGRVVAEEAVVRTGSDGGVVLETAAGIEALRCTGLAETLTYPSVPAGLSARPTLSVRMRTAQALTATVTLSYLASGFDWQADYVGILSADRRRLHLQAWLTLASNDDTSFLNATTQAVAGRLNRTAADVPPVQAPPIRLRCWPESKTSDFIYVAPDGSRLRVGEAALVPPPPPPPPPPAALSASEIVVTGTRLTAERERLGDLQLYRIPEPVTVAARAQKQVGLIDQPAVRVQPVHSFDMSVAGARDVSGPARLLLRSRNRATEGLGLPLPAGRVILLGEGARRPLLLGEAVLDDRAVGDEVELVLDEAPGVRLLRQRDERDNYVLTLTNDRSEAVTAEVLLVTDGNERILTRQRLARRKGASWWDAVVPANGRVTLRYRIDDQAG